MNKVTSHIERVNILEVMGNAIAGGMEIYVARLIESLPVERFKVFCLCPFESRFTAQLRALGAEVYVAKFEDEPSWAALQLATTLVRTCAIDVIHSHLTNAHLLAGLTSKLTGAPALATIHGRSIALMDFEINRLTDMHVSVVCQSAYQQALSLGIRGDRIHLIPNGVATDVFAPRGKSDYLQRTLGLPAGTPLIGLIARLAPEKGPEVFLRMAWLARQVRPDLHYVLVGVGPLLEALQASVCALQLKEVVHFAGAQADMAQIYASLDLVVSSSHSEGMPLALLEAMASGLPVIATHVGGVAELIEVDTTGLLVEARDSEGLARAVIALMAEPELRHAMGRAARTRVEENFTLQASTEHMLNLLSALAQSAQTTNARRMSTIASVGTASSGKTTPAAKSGALSTSIEPLATNDRSN